MTALLPQRAGVPRRAPTARPTAPPRTRPDLRAVPATAPRRQVVPTWAYSAAAALVLSLGVIGIVALNALAAEASFESRALERDISELTLRHDDLVAEVATLAAPARVRDVARAQLGLIEPEQPGFLTLQSAQLDPDDPKPVLQMTSDGVVLPRSDATAQG